MPFGSPRLAVGDERRFLSAPWAWASTCGAKCECKSKALFASIVLCSIWNCAHGTHWTLAVLLRMLSLDYRKLDGLKITQPFCFLAFHAVHSLAFEQNAKNRLFHVGARMCCGRVANVRGNLSVGLCFLEGFSCHLSDVQFISRQPNQMLLRWNIFNS